MCVIVVLERKWCGKQFEQASAEVRSEGKPARRSGTHMFVSQSVSQTVHRTRKPEVPCRKAKTHFKPFRTNEQHFEPNAFVSYRLQIQEVSAIGVTHLVKRILRVAKCVTGFLLKTGSATYGQHGVYVCHRSNIPWLHHTNCIKVYQANRCTFRLLRTILGKLPALKG